MECPNYILCGNTTDNKDYFSCYGGTCLNCDYFFSRNKMEISENKTCCVCADDELQVGIKFPNCSHFLCIDDMKKYYRNNVRTLLDFDFDNNCELFENSTNTHPPEFPYDENIENAYELYKMESEYDSHINFENDELIIKYETDLDNYCENRDDWIENNCYNTFLKKCPLCRENLGFSQELYETRN
jgi:hypothetical protein